MAPQTFARFLRSLAAIQVHLLFGVAIVLLAVGLITGDAPKDGKLAILFCVVAYPVVLGLLWWQRKSEITTARKDAIEREDRPAEFTRKRNIYRMIVLAILFIVSAGLIVAGFRGWLLSGIPAQYLGYAMLVFTVAGLAGVNIWYGGPLDMRADPEPMTFDEDVT